MHNLLLGTSKMMLELWKSSGILSVKDTENIQLRVDSFVRPSEVGCIPSKFHHHFQVSLLNSGKIGQYIFLPMLSKVSCHGTTIIAG